MVFSSQIWILADRCKIFLHKEGNYLTGQGGIMLESDSGGSGSGVQEEKSVYLFF